METKEQKKLRIEYSKLTKDIEDARHKREMFLIDNEMWDIRQENTRLNY